jgi:hypothetical protein
MVTDGKRSETIGATTQAAASKPLGRPETRLTTEPVQAGNFTGIAPEFGRTADVTRHFGIKRGTLYNLHHERKVRGVVLRVRGKQKGVRLWDMQSIRDFILSQPDSFGDDDDNDHTLIA